jgi:osmotically-inducible protein OsmY
VAARQATHAGETVKGKATAVAPGTGREPAEERLNDPALKAKVESEIFRSADTPKDRVNVSVEDGVVYLRGELETKKAIDELARSTRSVEGVDEVVNLLHRPGEEAPSKENGHGRGGAKRPSGQTRGKAERQAPARSK